MVKAVASRRNGTAEKRSVTPHSVRVGYNKDKFRELILYVVKRSENDARLGAVKLNKLLFFADRQAYGQLGHAISGARYHKIQHGPAAAALVPVRDEMIDSGDLEVRQEKLGGKYQPQVHFVAHREADPSAFSEDERTVVDEVIAKYKDMNGTQISEESYKELGVLLAQENEDIPYGTVYLPDAPPTKKDIVYAQRRMKARGWATG